MNSSYKKFNFHLVFITRYLFQTGSPKASAKVEVKDVSGCLSTSVAIILDKFSQSSSNAISRINFHPASQKMEL